MKTNEKKYFDKVWGVSREVFKKRAAAAQKIKKITATASEAVEKNILNGEITIDILF